MVPTAGDAQSVPSAEVVESVSELDYEDYFNPAWFNDETFVEEVFTYGETSIVLCGLSWNTVQSGAGYSRIGHTLWAAGHFLANFLYHHPGLIQGKRILEIGCGLGLTGLLAGKLAGNPGNVVLTDGDENILDALQRNIDRNFPERTPTEPGPRSNSPQRPACSVLSWGEAVEEFRKQYGQFDVIIGADVLYTEASLESLVATFCLLLNSEANSIVLIAFQTQYGGRLRDTFLGIASERLIGEQLEWNSSEVKLLKSSRNDDPVDLELWRLTWKH